MNETILDRLSPRERACLRLVADLRSDKEIARQLDIGPATVKTLVGRAMRKLGTTSRQDAARLLLSHEPRPPNWGTYRQGGQSDGDAPASTESPEALRADPVADAVREECAAFTFDELPLAAVAGPGRTVEYDTLHRMLLMAAFALAIVILGVASLPLADGAQRVANMLDPPRTNR